MPKDNDRRYNCTIQKTSCDYSTKLPPYSHLRVEVNTVDGFQGKECDVVVFSLTRTTGSYRFLADSRRLNVALSRARNNIIIVGYAVYAIKHKLFKAIFDQSVKWNEKTALGEW